MTADRRLTPIEVAAGARWHTLGVRARARHVPALLGLFAVGLAASSIAVLFTGAPANRSAATNTHTPARCCTWM